MVKSISLTAALEDYLEAILNLSRFDKAARSRDIAEALDVHKSTVTAALKSLGQMNLINYAPYEAVTLTAEGRRLAEDVAKRHSALKDFFVNILKVDVATAESAACGMEHAVPREIVEKLATFAQAMQDCPRVTEEAAPKCDNCTTCLENPAADSARLQPRRKDLTLDQIKPGHSAKLVSVMGGSQIKKRLTELGLTRGAVVAVERVAPMGDPMDIKLRGYRLSLRKEEAVHVVVTPVNEG